MRYLITFTCYGTHLHGDERGSVDRNNKTPNGPVAVPGRNRIEVMRRQMDQTPYALDITRRAVVVDALKEVCTHKGWTLWAAHARTNHVHAVVEAQVPSGKVLLTFKSYASRNLNRLQLDEPNRKRWARHGSTRWLWKDDEVQEAIRYVLYGQGEPMEVHFQASAVERRSLTVAVR